MNKLLFVIASVFASSMIAADNPAGAKMKAIVIHQYGGAEVLKYEDAARPEPGDDQVLVKVAAAGVNPVDVGIRGGGFAKFFKTTLPLIPGYDIAGVVEKAGAKVTKLKVGDPVFAYLPLARGGGYAEYALATEKEAAPRPKTLNNIEAAAAPLVALTAWQSLIDAAKLAPGQTVLIHGGSGGVGSFAIQIAKAKGAKVIATASTRNQDLLKELGADVAIDYTTQKFEEIAKEVDVVLDSVGSDTLKRSYGVVKKRGFIASIVDRPDPAELEQRGIRGSNVLVQPDATELAEIGKLIDEKKIKVVVSQVLPLAEAGKAQAQVASGHTRGKVVLKIGEGQ